MSWSKKILFLYLGFVALILTMVFTCFAHKTDLEYKDYYSRELRFQDQLNAGKNAAALSEPISHAVKEKQLLIHVPEELLTNDINGDIELMYPSDASRDINVPLRADSNGDQSLSVPLGGHYRLRVNISSNGKEYFHEALLTFK